MIKNSRPTTTCKTSFLKVSGMVIKVIWYTPLGIIRELEFVTKLGMGLGRNGNRLPGNGRQRGCEELFVVTSTVSYNRR